MAEIDKEIKFGLRAKILLVGLLPSVAILILIIGLSLAEMYRNLKHLSEEKIIEQLQAVADEIDKANLRTVTVAQTMALAQENGMFGKRKESLAYAWGVLESFPELTGSYFGYEPNADGQDAEALKQGTVPKTSMSATGRFIPYWFRNRVDNATIELEPLVDMESSFYYQGNKNQFLGKPDIDGIFLANDDKPPIPILEAITKYYVPAVRDNADKKSRIIITEPYVYVGKLIVEQTYPIIINGQFKGIAGVDRSLNYLDGFLKKLKPFNSSDFILVSLRGRVISASMNDGLKAKPLEKTPYHDMLKDFYQMKDRSAFILAKDPVDGKSYYFAASRVPTGNWTLVMRVSEKEIKEPIQSAIVQASMLTLVGLAVVAVIVVLLTGKVISRIQRAADAAHRVAGGDLTVQVEADSTDEAGFLLRAIQGMVKDLSSLVSKVKTSSIQLVSTATQIGAAAKQQESTFTEFGTSTNQIAAAVKEISATSQELVRTMKDVTNVASETASMADSGRSSLGGMETAMTNLSQATTSISSSLSIINEKANNIGSVITTITKVADQTNLLSLNAAIEAEKAGEYGLGFSVVAREIRRLADQTAVATLDIEQMVKEMQSSVSTGVMQMDKFTEEVRRGVEETAQISSQFGRIIEQVQALTPRFDLVHEGMQSQSQGAQQISDAMLQLTESIRGSSASLREFNQAAEQLHQAVRSLKDEVSRFKVS